MLTWTLILMITAPHRGGPVTIENFKTLEQCEAAAQSIRETVGDDGLAKMGYERHWCVQIKK